MSAPLGDLPVVAVNLAGKPDRPGRWQRWRIKDGTLDANTAHEFGHYLHLVVRIVSKGRDGVGSAMQRIIGKNVSSELPSHTQPRVRSVAKRKISRYSATLEVELVAESHTSTSVLNWPSELAREVDGALIDALEHSGGSNPFREALHAHRSFIELPDGRVALSVDSTTFISPPDHTSFVEYALAGNEVFRIEGEAVIKVSLDNVHSAPQPVGFTTDVVGGRPILATPTPIARRKVDDWTVVSAPVEQVYLVAPYTLVGQLRSRQPQINYEVLSGALPFVDEFELRSLLTFEPPTGPCPSHLAATTDGRLTRVVSEPGATISIADLASSAGNDSVGGQDWGVVVEALDGSRFTIRSAGVEALVRDGKKIHATWLSRRQTWSQFEDEYSLRRAIFTIGKQRQFLRTEEGDVQFEGIRSMESLPSLKPVSPTILARLTSNRRSPLSNTDSVFMAITHSTGNDNERAAELSYTSVERTLQPPTWGPRLL